MSQQTHTTRQRHELHHNVRRVIGKCSPARYERTICDVLAVASRVKPAVLIDQITVDAEQLRRFLRLLQYRFACVSLKDLMIVSLGELGALFVAHSSAVVDMQKKFGTCATTLGESLLIVNVTSNLAQPLHTFIRHDTHMSSRWHSSIIEVLKHFTEQLTAAVEDRAVHPGDICDSATVDTFAGEGSTVTITYPHPINLTTLYGFILDYPCLYWYDHVLSTANCLSMTPLRLYDCEFSATSPSETGPGAWFRTVPYRFTSFSIPGCIADSLAETWEERMGLWTTRLQERVRQANQVWGKEVCEVRQTTVELTQVAL